jgi:nitrate/nitrite transporter NarK
MTTVGSGRGPTSELRVRAILLLLIAWDALGLVAEFTFGRALFKVSDGQIGGIIGGHGAFGGAMAVPLALYIYALVRGPLRYRGLLWVAVLEQAVLALTTVYHLAVDDLKFESGIGPLAVSLILVALLLLNMPRDRTTS